MRCKVTHGLSSCDCLVRKANRLFSTKDSAMPIIDSQVHAYEANTPKRPWHNVPNWPPHVTGDEMVAAMDKVCVDGEIGRAHV